MSSAASDVVGFVGMSRRRRRRGTAAGRRGRGRVPAVRIPAVVVVAVVVDAGVVSVVIGVPFAPRRRGRVRVVVVSVWRDDDDAFDDVVARRLIGIRRRPRWRRSSPPTPPRARARTSRSTPASRRPPRATVSRGGPGVCAGISTAGGVRRRDDARRGRRRRRRRGRGAGPPAATPPAMDPPRRRLDAPDDAWILPPRPGTTPSRPPPRPMGRAPRGIAPPPGCRHP